MRTDTCPRLAQSQNNLGAIGYIHIALGACGPPRRKREETSRRTSHRRSSAAFTSSRSASDRLRAHGTVGTALSDVATRTSTCMAPSTRTRLCRKCSPATRPTSYVHGVLGNPPSESAREYVRPRPRPRGSRVPKSIGSISSPGSAQSFSTACVS